MLVDGYALPRTKLKNTLTRPLVVISHPSRFAILISAEALFAAARVAAKNRAANALARSDFFCMCGAGPLPNRIGGRALGTARKSMGGGDAGVVAACSTR